MRTKAGIKRADQHRRVAARQGNQVDSPRLFAARVFILLPVGSRDDGAVTGDCIGELGQPKKLAVRIQPVVDFVRYRLQAFYETSRALLGLTGRPDASLNGEIGRVPEHSVSMSSLRCNDENWQHFPLSSIRDGKIGHSSLSFVSRGPQPANHAAIPNSRSLATKYSCGRSPLTLLQRPHIS